MPTRLRPLLLLLLALAAASALAACGGDDGEKASSSTDVNQLLRETFSGDKQVKSGRLQLALKIDAQGEAARQLQGPVSIRLSGPFQTQGEGRLPKLAIDLAFEGAGQSLQAGVTSTGDKGFVSFRGTDYAVSDQVFRQFKAGFEQAQQQGGKAKGQSFASLGMDPTRWLTNPRNAGDAKVGDTDTIKITGDVSVDRLLDDISRALGQARSLGIQGTRDLPARLTPEQRKQVDDAVKSLSVEIHTGKDDRILRRMLIRLGVAAPASEGGGSADVTFDLSLLDVNEDQEIEAPADARPFDQLLQQLGGLGLGGLGAGPGGSGSADAGALKEYSDCIAAAGSDTAQARKCADLLQTP
jgi:hypothetical protein